jgi:hypothetical protein
MTGRSRAESQFDEHRNTSRVWPVPPQVIDAARRSQAVYERTKPPWYRWIIAGCPELTPEQYAAGGGLHAPKARRRTD